MKQQIFVKGRIQVNLNLNKIKFGNLTKLGLFNFFFIFVCLLHSFYDTALFSLHKLFFKWIRGMVIVVMGLALNQSKHIPNPF